MTRGRCCPWRDSVPFPHGATGTCGSLCESPAGSRAIRTRTSDIAARFSWPYGRRPAKASGRRSWWDATGQGRLTRRRLWGRGCDGFASSRLCPASPAAFSVGSHRRSRPQPATRDAGPRCSSLLSRRKRIFPAGQEEVFANRRMPAPESSQGNRGMKPVCQATENRNRDAVPPP